MDFKYALNVTKVKRMFDSITINYANSRFTVNL